LITTNAFLKKIKRTPQLCGKGWMANAIIIVLSRIFGTENTITFFSTRIFIFVKPYFTTEMVLINHCHPADK